MTTHVIINLAEETSTGTGVTSKVQDAVEEQGKKKKRHGFFWAKTRIVQTATVYKYDLVEHFDPGHVGGAFGIDRDLLNEIQLRIGAADKVYYCAHGSATDRDNVFTQRGTIGSSRVERLASLGQFTDFARLVFPATAKVYNLHLIVCFAARSVNPDRSHTRSFLRGRRDNYAALRTSLAYRFYKALHDGGVHSKMYARLGEVRVAMSNEYAMDILTQTEGGVQAGLRLSRASHEEQRLGTTITDLRKAELRYIASGSQGLPPPTEAERPWFEAYKEATTLKAEQGMQAMTTGQGRLTYQATGANLKIDFEGKNIYEGPYF